MTEVNRRKFSRISLDRNVDLHCENTLYSCELVDISLNGLLLDEPEGFPAKAPTQLRSRVFLSEKDHIDMTLSLAHRHNGLLGFQCNNIDVDSISHLRRLIELNLGDSNACERELADLIHSTDKIDN